MAHPQPRRDTPELRLRCLPEFTPHQGTYPAAWQSPTGDADRPPKHPAVMGTTELCGPTRSRPLLNSGWAANDQKHEPLRRGVTNGHNDMDVALYLRHRSPRCS